MDYHCANVDDSSIINTENYMGKESFDITPELAHKLINVQFPEFSDLTIVSVEKQGHDNRTYRLGNELLIRLPTAQSYALKVPKEQALLPKLASQLNIRIPGCCFQ